MDELIQNFYSLKVHPMCLMKCHAEFVFVCSWLAREWILETIIAL